jgi:rhodanese-related sulfurtransferase
VINKRNYNKTTGTAICKVFELTVGLSGVSEKEIKRSQNEEIKNNYVKVYANVASKVGYYPGSAMIWCKLIFHKVTGRVYGVQMIGTNDVDKRIDVLSVVIRKGMTVFELEDLELSYAPPFNSPVDPVNILGHIGSNYIKGSHDLWYFDHSFDLVSEQVLDVRTADEVARGVIPNSLHIPLDDLRNHIEKIDKSKEILVYCQSGLRGYVACRILSDLGYKTKNLTGGYIVYSNWKSLHPQL